VSCHRYDGKAFHTRGQAAEKLLLLKLLCVRGTTHILSDADLSWGRPVSAVSWMSEVRYVGVCSANDWCTRHASLNSTLRWIGSQCSFCRTGVMCSQCRVPAYWHSVQIVSFLSDCWTCSMRVKLYKHCYDDGAITSQAIKPIIGKITLSINQYVHNILQHHQKRSQL